MENLHVANKKKANSRGDVGQFFADFCFRSMNNGKVELTNENLREWENK